MTKSTLILPFLLVLSVAGAPALAEEGAAEAPMTVDEFVAVNLKMLADMDMNKDGIVVKEEIAQRMAAGMENPPTQEVVDSTFAAIDANGDGKVTAAEVEPYERASFKAKDTDGDGLLTSEERRTAEARAGQ